MKKIKYVNFTDKRYFGVEMEMLRQPLSQAKIVDIIADLDSKHSAIEVGWLKSSQGYEKSWNVKTDSSCGSDGLPGIEVASFKSKGAKDLSLIGDVADSIRKAGGVVDDRCAFHVHVDAGDLSDEQVATLVAYWMKIESIVVHMIPLHRAKNKYARMLSRVHSGLKYDKGKNYTAKDFWAFIRPKDDSNKSRRVALNVCPYAHDECMSTVELRLPEGTLFGADIKNWVKFFVRFVHYCKDKPFPADGSRVNLVEALQILGIHSTDDEFYILSKGMRETKEWLLHRILNYGRNKRLCKGAVDVLNDMWYPFKKFSLPFNQYAEAI